MSATPDEDATVVEEGHQNSPSAAPLTVSREFKIVTEGIEDFAYTNFEVGASLGAGAAGTVVQAKASFGDVAIKVFPAFQSAGDVEIFVREVRNVARIQHPNAVNIFGITLDGPRGPGIVLELLDGPFDPLRHRHPRKALSIVRSVAEAITFIHQNGLLHLDVRRGSLCAARVGAFFSPLTVVVVL